MASPSTSAVAELLVAVGVGGAEVAVGVAGVEVVCGPASTAAGTFEPVADHTPGGRVGVGAGAQACGAGLVVAVVVGTGGVAFLFGDVLMVGAPVAVERRSAALEARAGALVDASAAGAGLAGDVRSSAVRAGAEDLHSMGRVLGTLRVVPDSEEIRSELLKLHDRMRTDESPFLAGQINALLWVSGRSLVLPHQEAARRAGEWGPASRDPG